MSSYKANLAACGEASFVERMREAVIKNTSKENVIRFVEAEYRPPKQVRASTSIAPWAQEPELRQAQGRPSDEPMTFQRHFGARIFQAQVEDHRDLEAGQKAVKKRFEDLDEPVIHPRILQAQSEDQRDFEADVRSEKIALRRVAAFKTSSTRTRKVQSENGVLGYTTLRSQKLPESNLKISVIAKLDKELVKVTNVE